MAEGATGVSPQMSRRVWPPAWPSWIEALAPPAWIASTRRRKPWQESVVKDAELAMPMPPGALRRCHLDSDQPDAAAHPRHVIGDAVVGNMALLVRQPRGHRRHDDAVLDLDGADARRREQDGHAKRYQFAVPESGRTSPVVSSFSLLYCGETNCITIDIAGHSVAISHPPGASARPRAGLALEMGSLGMAAGLIDPSRSCSYKSQYRVLGLPCGALA